MSPVGVNMSGLSVIVALWSMLESSLVGNLDFSSVKNKTSKLMTDEYKELNRGDYRDMGRVPNRLE